MTIRMTYKAFRDSVSPSWKDGKPHRCNLNGIMVNVEITDEIPKLTGNLCEHCGGAGTVGEDRPTDSATVGRFFNTAGYLPTNVCRHCGGAGTWEEKK